MLHNNVKLPCNLLDHRKRHELYCFHMVDGFAGGRKWGYQAYRADEPGGEQNLISKASAICTQSLCEFLTL